MIVLMNVLVAVFPENMIPIATNICLILGVKFTPAGRALIVILIAGLAIIHFVVSPTKIGSIPSIIFVFEFLPTDSASV
jgi:hypothetical protein